MIFKLLSLMLLIGLAACRSSPAPAALPVTTAPVTQPAVTPVTQPTSAAATVVPVKTVPTSTQPPPVSTDTAVPQPANTVTAPAATKPRPAPTSTGPLSVAIYTANCRSAATAEKPGRVIVQISIEASGGNGRYRYFYTDQEFPTKFIEVIGEKGTRTIGDVLVTSGDGQEVKQPFDISIGQLNCP